MSLLLMFLSLVDSLGFEYYGEVFMLSLLWWILRPSGIQREFIARGYSDTNSTSRHYLQPSLKSFMYVTCMYPGNDGWVGGGGAYGKLGYGTMCIGISAS